MQDVTNYVVIKKYKGRTIEVKVRDQMVNSKRLTVIACDYNSNVISFENGSDEKVDYYIKRFIVLGMKKIDENSFVKKIGKLFK